jgi:uncharacterized protein (TIGR00251 family)
MSAAATDVEIMEQPGGVELSVKVVPGASRSRVVGRWGRALRLAVSAPAQHGRANAAMLKLLATTFGVKRGDVTIVSGQIQPIKRVHISGVSAQKVRAILSRVIGREAGR